MIFLSKGSNRTFMELKFQNEVYNIKATLSSNRTFMELKFRLNRSASPGQEVF